MKHQLKRLSDVLFDSEIPHQSERITASPYWNKDIAPIGKANRTWTVTDFTVLWIGMSACVPTYMLASSLIDGGMNWWQAVLTIFLGNCIVLIPMVLNAHAGAKYGIPYPVYCRPAFGILGANIPALLRAFVACGWFGIQTWIGGAAVYKLISIAIPSMASAPVIFDGLNPGQWGCFLFFWAINMIVIHKGVESIRLLLTIKAPLLISLGLALLAWAYVQAGGFGAMLSTPSQFGQAQPKEGQFWSFFFPALTANIGFWATLSLNIPDFSRYARSQKDQILGQALGLPASMGLFSFIGVAVTSATLIIYGRTIWNPIELISQFQNSLVLAIALIALILATLATNIAANVVGPANDFSHLWPEKIDFRIGGYITGIIGILIQPWKLIADPSGYIFKWLVAYSALLGSVGGILICDYFLIRGGKLDTHELYAKNGAYWYAGGVNGVALVALAMGVTPLIPGFLGTVGLMEVSRMWISFYHYAWFISFAVSFAAYRIFTKWGENT